MTAQELRQKYLDFFKNKGHEIVPSSSLVPENDATTLFTGSGMQPMLEYLLGAKHPLGTRIADSQKSFRSQDIEEVGDNRHTTFFEMLGNWSLGDYFKQEQIPWMFEFLIDVVGLDPEKLYITCFIGAPEFGIPKDTEAAELWQKLFQEKGIEAKIVDIDSEENGYQRGIKPGERIFFFDGSKNWWNRGKTGPRTTAVGDPCGPDSEMFFDFGTPHDPKFGTNCHPNCDCGRFMEIGNNVFMAYKKESENSFVPLEKQNIDHGSGLERIAAAIEGSGDVFKISLLWPLIETLQKISGKSYDSDFELTRGFRIIADHVRAAVFLVGDGVEPSNKDRGYVLRRLLRRSMVYGKTHGFPNGWLKEVVDSVIATYKDAYSNLAEEEPRIIESIQSEERKFTATLEKGLKEFEKLIKRLENMSDRSGLLDTTQHATRSALPNGTDAFNLYQTFGFPWELTHELAEKKGLNINKDEFEAEFKKHQDLSRTASAGEFKGGLANHSDKVVRLHTTTHLMHKALRDVLGDHVWQKGSNITEERTRFDFTHPQKMTPEEIKQVEDLVNKWIQLDGTMKPEVMPLAKARELGAIGLFGEKYGDTVSVYTVTDPKTGEVISREFCGGPHVKHTGEIGGTFKIVKEEAVSAGVRRIKAVIQ
jgi:alanyl-tRNA synthetase